MRNGFHKSWGPTPASWAEFDERLAAYKAAEFALTESNLKCARELGEIGENLMREFEGGE